MWRYADGDLNALVYDVSLRVACMSDPCSVAKCGHQASCHFTPKSPDLSFLFGLNRTLPKDERPKASCECKDGFVGNPYDRCFPANVTSCGCERLVFSTKNGMAIAKHENSFGEFFLFDVGKEGYPIYQAIHYNHTLLPLGEYNATTQFSTKNWVVRTTSFSKM